MKKTLLSAVVSVVAAVWMVGCGGSVTSGSGGDGGSGGSGGSTATAGSGGDTGTTTTTVTGMGSLCEQLCNAGLEASCFMGPASECIQSCEMGYTQFPDCKAEMDAAFECGVAAVPVSGCDLEMACGQEFAAVQACENGGCGEGTCSGDGTSCSCSSLCNGVTLQVDCQSSAGGIDCTCIEDDVTVGTCTGSDLSCPLTNGCCAQFFGP